VQTRSAPSTAARAESTGSTRTPWRSDSRAAKASRFARLGLKTRTRRKRRATAIASRCVRAWTPEPRSARSPASSRASRRVATPLAAAVRIAVISLASRIVRGTPFRGSNSTTTPWCAS
jgi:hypothetical protein